VDGAAATALVAGAVPWVVVPGRGRNFAITNQITPSGNVVINDKAPMVPVNSVVGERIKDLEKIPVRLGVDPTVYVGDIGSVLDTTDVPTGYGLVDGKRSVYVLVTKRADSSTLAVVNEVKANLPRMQAAAGEGINVRFEFDQSPYVTRATSCASATYIGRLVMASIKTG
jgi:multidrug efflux pump subunit AcrB